MGYTTFKSDFGSGFSIRQSVNLRTDETTVIGYLHRLTPKQFDALVDAFQTVGDVRTLNTTGAHGTPQTFRTADIKFGGLNLALYSDIPVDNSSQLTLF